MYMPAYFEKIASTRVSRKLAHFLIAHSGNNHHPYLLRHEALFAFTFIILLVQFFSFSGISSANVLGYGTDINRATLISLTNQERSARGVAPLQENTALNQAAALKADHMFAQDYWAHFAPDGTSPWYFFNQVGYKYAWAGENLARDFSTSAGVIAGWMASTGHRDNMLNPNFSDVGIGIKNGTLEGEQTTLVVEHLGKALGDSTKSSGSTGGSTSKSLGVPVTVEEKFQPVEKTSENKSEATASANITKIEEKIASAVTPFNWNISGFWKSLGLGQKTTLLLLTFLLGLFVFDSIIVFRKGIIRHNSHSLLHAIVLAILIIAVIRSATGGIL